MFGSKNKENIEKIQSLSEELEYKDEVYQVIADHSSMFEGNTAEYQSSMEQMTSDLKHISENLDASGAILSENGKLISALHDTLHAAEEDTGAWKKANESFQSHLDKIADNSRSAVENNKHFTEPSKVIGDIADQLKSEYMDNNRELKMMAEYSKQMSVLALNAAIEAGRMGESGAQFVNAAESVRSYAANYDTSVQALQQRFDQSQQKIGKLEEEIHTLIALLKDNNVAVSKIMKDLKDLSKEAEKVCQSAPVNNFDQLLETTKLLHDAESEVDRMEARNRMQMDDVLREAEIQSDNVKEITDTLEQATALMK